MASRDLNDLEPQTRFLAQKLIDLAEQNGIKLLVTETFRSADEQDKIFSQKPKVTNARGGQSWHQFRCALDVVPLDNNNHCLWNRLDLFNQLGQLGKSLGFIWGGDFSTFKDMPHFEYHPGLNLSQAQAKYGRERKIDWLTPQISTKNVSDYPDLIAFVKLNEGLRLTCYSDIAGISTIGYGHTGSDVKIGETISQIDADNLLIKDLQHALNVVQSHITEYKNDDGVLKALTSFVFNLGEGNFEKSTLLKLLNGGQKELAAQQFPEWAMFRKNGVLTVNKGLLNRRKKEQWCFENGKFLGF